MFDDVVIEAIHAIERLVGRLHHRPIDLLWTIGPVHEQPQFHGPGVVKIMATAAQLTDTQQAQVSVTKRDRKGQSTQDEFDAPPTWTSTDETVATVTPNDDGALVVAGVPGSCQVNFTAVNNGVPIVGSLDVIVVPGDVVSVDIAVGAPTEQV